MKYIKALLIKFIMMTAILWIVLGTFFGISFLDILTTSVVLTGISFIIGDLLILPKFGNMWATVADFGLAFFGVWALGSFLFEQPVSLETISFFLAVAITVGEFFFHGGLMKSLVLEGVSSTEKQDMGLFADKNLHAEFGSDRDIKRDIKNDSKRKK